jgi:hypothetical protein
MSQFVKYTLIAIGLNLLSFGLFILPAFLTSSGHDRGTSLVLAFFGAIVSLIVQLLVALIFLLDEKKKQIGQAMLLSVGLFLLVGFSFCGVF